MVSHKSVTFISARLQPLSTSNFYELSVCAPIVCVWHHIQSTWIGSLSGRRDEISSDQCWGVCALALPAWKWECAVESDQPEGYIRRAAKRANPHFAIKLSTWSLRQNMEKIQSFQRFNSTLSTVRSPPTIILRLIVTVASPNRVAGRGWTSVTLWRWLLLRVEASDLAVAKVVARTWLGKWTIFLLSLSLAICCCYYCTCGVCAYGMMP